MSFPSRRTFLQTAVAAIASFFLPKGLRAGEKPKEFWLLHTPTGDSWPVGDPVAWCLTNAGQPILERASKRLRTLTPADDQRIIRLVTRRCKLNLLELRPGQVLVHYWGQQGKGDMRPFFKTHGLTSKDVEVTLINRKRELVTVQHGDDFLYGQPLSPLWLLNVYWLHLYWKKWERARFIHACRQCQRCFRDSSIDRFDVGKWMVANLDAEVWPDFILWMGKPMQWSPPSD